MRKPTDLEMFLFVKCVGLTLLLFKGLVLQKVISVPTPAAVAFL